MNAAKTGQLIAQARKERSMTQGELAQQLHVSAQAVSKWERGLNFPDITLLEPLSQTLGMTVSELISGQPGSAPEEGTLKTWLHTALDQMGRRVRRWRSLFWAAAALLLLLAAWSGWRYIRDNTRLLPQPYTLITPRKATDSEWMAAQIVAEQSIYFFDVTLADDFNACIFQLELWTHQGLEQSWELGRIANLYGVDKPRRVDMALALDFQCGPDSAVDYSLAFWDYVWRGTVEVAYLERGTSWNTLEDPARVSEQDGVVLMCACVDPSGQGQWRFPGCLGAVQAPQLDPGQGFLLLRMVCDSYSKRN